MTDTHKKPNGLPPSSPPHPPYTESVYVVRRNTTIIEFTAVQARQVLQHYPSLGYHLIVLTGIYNAKEVMQLSNMYTIKVYLYTCSQEVEPLATTILQSIQSHRLYRLDANLSAMIREWGCRLAWTLDWNRMVNETKQAWMDVDIEKHSILVDALVKMNEIRNTPVKFANYKRKHPIYEVAA